MSAPSLETTMPPRPPGARSDQENPDPASDDLREAEAVFDDARKLMFGIAYRMLGSVREAEDVLRNVWLRWGTSDHTEVQDMQASLITMVTRLAMLELHASRVRRESYVGFWLPEPVATTNDPPMGAANEKALGVAALTLMEQLTPAERAAYVLREAYDCSYARVAEIIGLSQADAYRLVIRAREFLADAPLAHTEN
ncbi:sigma factor-like helix-turn-helix DNA-binding protein [Actinacidiphila glaucinigra]|uniref:RNA polymerase sigma-70 factor, ECF subfamily n=1 Tax=Actinacidiphila glaucinigra TaxID=235986 RepID=A0A239JRE7_9ACTN|nr:sigma factor-like helix-turn-helix DNA-binding protein [Actinacidiphila glaucinigra]SNT07988.1 RNA polymerase sigma-70 factor, ECF subfamily [Actinacidiphila glaucinigra]